MAKGIKTGGREPGTCNIITKEIRESFQNLVEQNLSEIQNWITSTAKKDPVKAVELILKLSEFCLPKLKAIEFKIPEKPEVQLTPEQRKTEIAKLKAKLFSDEN